jgi:hypothetical protein
VVGWVKEWRWEIDFEEVEVGNLRNLVRTLLRK